MEAGLITALIETIMVSQDIQEEEEELKNYLLLLLLLLLFNYNIYNFIS